ncbi:hypothetical protein CKAH01_17088 [Colletotrichum kahawae]|uniref:Uncharacterized protein n=1 Tax=Colletotrichum kahawae TaxID=34407 RepID=A0AAE0D5S1_COLKA|nr:hypothetical protein CKAH01_17088 [Colletotrichum kahawae]
MLTDYNHLIYLGDHLGIDRGNYLRLLTFIINYLLSLRLITLASEDLIYYKLITYNLDYNPNILLLYVNP